MKITQLIFIGLAFCCLVFCQNPIVGHEFMMAGYDLRNASTKAIGDRVKSSIFQETFDFKKKYQRPNTTDVYDVPDEFDAFWRSSKSSLTSSDIHHTVDDYLHEETSSYSFGIGFNLGAFGAKASYNRSQGYVHWVYTETLDAAAFGYVNRIVSLFNMGPFVLFKKSGWFDQIMNAIPTCPSTEQDYAAVQMLIDTYGHVFPSSLSLGGYFKTITTVSQDILKKKDISWVTEQLSLSFTYKAFDISGGMFKNKSDIHISEDFAKACRTSEFFEGGTDQSNETLVKWYESLVGMPGVVGGSFRPISDLVTNDINKKKNLEQLLINHANKGVVGQSSCSQTHRVQSHDLPPIQGFEFLGGYDSLSQSPRAGLFDHTFDSATMWSNPIYPEYQFAVPSTIGVFNNPESVEQNYTFVAMSKEEYQTELRDRSAKYQTGAYITTGSESNDMYVYAYFHDYRNEVMAENMRMITWYDLELSPMIRFDAINHMNPYAKYMFTRLGADLNDINVRRHYVQLLNAYGDHVVTRVSMGVRINQKTYINQNVLKAISISHFHEQSGWSFLGLFGSKHKRDVIDKQITEQMRKNARIEVKVDGGFTNGAFKGLKLENNGYYSFDLKDNDSNLMDWDEFVKSAKDNMEPIHYEVMPIYELIRDPVIRQNMMVMAKEYASKKDSVRFGMF
ncbi:PV21 [Acrasis kona]|uniref:PV21 n=1 Tax=Acrasis kona TaxID=1008807 RepID=A0AAW2ZGG3_9EUKA